MKILVAALCLAILLSGCGSSLRYRVEAWREERAAPRCDAIHRAELCYDAYADGQTWFIGLPIFGGLPDGPAFCRCPDKPVSPQ